MVRLALVWQALHYAVPIFWLYALLFADSGLSVAEISALFAIWSSAGIVVEVPSGALADRWSRRGSVVASGFVIAAGFAVWTVLPTFAGFTAGFVLWGVGASLASGALEALLYDGLAEHGATESYPRVNGALNAIAQLAQIPAGLAAGALYELGGYVLVGWVSVGCCLVSSIPALFLPEPRPAPDPTADAEGEPGWWSTMVDGVRESVRTRAVGVAVLAVAVLGGVDAIEEYFPLVASDAGTPTAFVPLALLVVPVAGALGSAAGGRVRGWTGVVLLVGSAAALGAVALTTHPAGLVGVTLFWGLYQAVRVCVESRLQDRIRGRARATVTSVASFGTEFSGIALFGAWALGGAGLVAALVLVCAPLLRPRAGPEDPESVAEHAESHEP
ncbi:putative MFS family arabinose efflux permease [Pseudonocardia sediminis]|uniref:Putative MFS family arabinose efflux permease n=1 Tax=Pseudonocardia sediminis TaxID=1397368 RepID=A0A4Q7V5I8_PSEST|nr:MFS transporter [Pseudonocardia sediminis]RZT87929.1 putative MFS family arabinose efflux permease [Pseudonocardia sediminis]